MPDTITTAAERYLIAVDKLHQVYGSTSACWGGAGGMSLTAHCGWGCDNPAHAHDQAEFVAAEAELRDALASPDAEPAMRLPRVADGCCCTWCSEDRGANHSETWDRALAAHDAEVAAKALEDAADDPRMRSVGHSGVGVRKLRARAAALRGGGQ